MLTNLHVKNLALIDEVDIDFKKGLNIITGETGAGKSLVLGSVNLALGGKADSGIIGKYGDSALVEISFLVDDEKVRELEAIDVFPEDNVVTISRRILEGRSVIKVNGETMSATAVRKITELLIDIHGQHDHQSLLYKAKHLEILDRFAKDELEETKNDLLVAYNEYKKAMKKLEEFSISDEERMRKTSFLKFEIEEIENADLKDDEDLEVESLYRKIINSKKITEEADFVSRNLSTDNNNASDMISRALQGIGRIKDYDENMAQLYEQLADVDNLLNDFNKDFASYLQTLDFDSEIFESTEKRLDQINNLKAKYGGSISSIKEYLEEAKEKLVFYEEYENQFEEAKTDLLNKKTKAYELATKVSDIRKKAAKELKPEIINALIDLNFSQVDFEINFTELNSITGNGMDEVEFMISLNPGEAIKPLAKVASGGELSRIMLGIKSVLAGKDDIDSLIFDEIDTGISGRTAQKVSEKMAVIAKKHQVICITHLPQIAAMADAHYLIEKKVVNDKSLTDIFPLKENEMIDELARMLGGMEITDVVRENAKQMKDFADELKK